MSGADGLAAIGPAIPSPGLRNRVGWPSRGDTRAARYLSLSGELTSRLNNLSVLDVGERDQVLVPEVASDQAQSRWLASWLGACKHHSSARQ